MRKIIILGFVILMAISNSKATTSDLFTYDETLIQNELVELIQLENYLLENTHLTFSELSSQKSLIFSNSVSSNLSFLSKLEDGPIALPMCWGCFLGPVGWLVVLVIYDRQKTPSMQAFKGCVMSGAFWAFILVGGHEFWGWWPGLYTSFQ